MYIHNVYTIPMENPGRKKKLVSIRISSDVLNWFKSSAEHGYQTLIHSVLEQYVSDQRLRSERHAGRAQELFRKFHARCFWHMDPNLVITPKNLPIVIEGLRKYGGREGLISAEELCQ